MIDSTKMAHDADTPYDSDEGDNDEYTHMFDRSCLSEESSPEKKDGHFYEWERTMSVSMSCKDETNDISQLLARCCSRDDDDPYWLETLAGDVPALQTALRNALVTNDVATVQELIDYGVIAFEGNNFSAMCEQSTGRTPIWYAASAGADGCIELLAEWFLHSYLSELHRQQASSVATRNEHQEEQDTSKARKELTAFLSHPSKHGSRPILVATVCNRPETVQTLLNYNVDVNSANDYSSTAALLAASEGHFEILNILAKHGANLDLPNLQGTTPVIVAAQNGRVDIIKFLYLYGVNLNHVNEMGMSCVAIAAFYNKVSFEE